jgi:3-phosphoshikimate 1-carboxyvinyltransferase
MGGQVKIHNLKEEFGERRGDLEVAFSSLRGVSIGKEIIPSLIDEVPILSVLATQAQGVTFITGAEELRVKECDRLRAMYLGLKTLGAKVEERSDGLIIEGPVTLHGGRVESFGDHRIAMSFAVAGLIAREAVEIVDVDCVKISYPEFFDHLQSLGCKRVEFYESEEEGEKSCL